MSVPGMERCEGMMAVSGRLVYQRAGDNGSARGMEPPAAPAFRAALALNDVPFQCDGAFDVQGDAAAGGVDVAAVLAAAAVRAGGRAWVGVAPGMQGAARRVRVSGQPLYGLGERVDAVFVVGGAPWAHVAPSGQPGPSAGVPLFADATRRDIPGARPLPLSALASRVPSVAYGDRLVLLGLWTWMCGLHPDWVRRTLENSLAGRSGRAVSAALRLFELGWREAPRWLSTWAARGDLSREAPAAPEAEGRAAGTASGTQGTVAVMSGVQALAAGARAGGLGRLRVASDHPWAEALGRACLTPGGRLSSDGLEYVVDALGTLPPAAGPRVVIRLARLGAGDDAPSNRATAPPAAGAAARAVVLAPTSVAECYSFAALAGVLAAQYRREVVVLTDAWLLGAFGRVPLGDAVVKRTAEHLFGPEAVVWGARAAKAPEHPSVELHIPEAPLEALIRPAVAAGGDEGDVLLLGWGATGELVEHVARRLRVGGCRVSALHLRTLWPLPSNLSATLAHFRRVVFVLADETTDAAVGRALLDQLGPAASLRVVVRPAGPELAAEPELRL